MIKSHNAFARACFEAMLYEDQLKGGKISMSWKIGPEGEVLSATTLLSTLPSPRVAECVRRGILTWRFPCPAGGGTVDVTYPYIFKVAGE